MTEGIIVALIGAGGAIVAALIGGIFVILKNGKKANENISIKQKQRGSNNIQIGQQNYYNDKENK